MSQLARNQVPTAPIRSSICPCQNCSADSDEMSGPKAARGGKCLFQPQLPDHIPSLRKVRAGTDAEAKEERPLLLTGLPLLNMLSFLFYTPQV